MADILATLFRFRQFLFEYVPFFLVSWLGLAVATGVLTAVMRKADNISADSHFLKRRPWRWLWQLLLVLLWQPGQESPAPNFSGWQFFGLAASVPGLVATSLIGLETMWLRLVLAAIFAPALSRIFVSIVLRRMRNLERQSLEIGSISPAAMLTVSQPAFGERRSNVSQVIWKSFSGQVERAVIPLIIGFGLASAVTIYIPSRSLLPWLGEGAWPGPYLAAVLVTPFQLVGGAEVALASALLVKGASLGTAMSVMLATQVSTFSMLRQVRSTRKVRTVALYLVAVWVTAGTIGAAVDGIERLFGM